MGEGACLVLRPRLGRGAGLRVALHLQQVAWQALGHAETPARWARETLERHAGGAMCRHAQRLWSARGRAVLTAVPVGRRLATGMVHLRQARA